MTIATTISRIEPTTGNRAAVAKYRTKNRRIDYVPAPDVAAIIDRWRTAGLNTCAAGVIDALVRAGCKALDHAHDVRTSATQGKSDAPDSACAREGAPPPSEMYARTTPTATPATARENLRS